ncbi:MAG: phosphotransferase [Pirellulales bacterium]
MAGQDAEVAAVLAEFSATSAFHRVIPLAAHGGLSGARLWRIETRDATFALRQWPAEHPPPERLRFVHAVLAHAFRRGCTRLSVPVAARDGETFVLRQGRLWELAPWLPGEASFERKPTRDKLANALRLLAQFHLACSDFDPRSGSSPGLVERTRRLAELDARLIVSLFRAIESNPVASKVDDLARSALANLQNGAAAVRPLLASAASLLFPLQPCLRDIWHGNLLFTGDEVTGVVDFGAMQIDSPALDVARLLGSMAGDDAEKWRSGLAAYEARRPLSADEHAAIPAADASGTVLGCVNWLRWLYVERRQFSDLSAVEMRMKSLAMRLRHLARA